MHNLELLFWIAALLVLFFLPVQTTENSLCVFRFLGFRHCPGCGIGHAIHDALHFQLRSSFRQHPFGIPGTLIIFIRIKKLLLNPKTAYETKSYQYDSRPRR